MKPLIAFAAAYLYIPVILGEILLVALKYRARWKELLLAALFIGGLSFGVALVLNGLVQDPRPFVEQGFTPLVPGSSDNGFPSDHTLLLAATAAVLMTVNAWAGGAGLLLALLVGYARVQAGFHHMLDIVGSLFIVGFVSAAYLAGWALVVIRQRRARR